MRGMTKEKTKLTILWTITDKNMGQCIKGEKLVIKGNITGSKKDLILGGG